MQLTAIAYAHNGFHSKFGIPRQSGRAKSIMTCIVFEPEFRNADALRGIEQFSHLWLIWGFSEAKRKQRGNRTQAAGTHETLTNDWSPTVRPPRLGGNTRIGVFATRSPFRPNGLGLSSVRLERVEQTGNKGTVLWVSGADLMDLTPIYDIKPYLPYTDIHADANSGFTAQHDDYRLEVVIAEDIRTEVDEFTRQAIVEILSEDPRPQYQDDPDRIYQFEYDNYHICFSVDGHKCYVKEFTPLAI